MGISGFVCVVGARVRVRLRVRAMNGAPWEMEPV